MADFNFKDKILCLQCKGCSRLTNASPLPLYVWCVICPCGLGTCHRLSNDSVSLRPQTTQPRRGRTHFFVCLFTATEHSLQQHYGTANNSSACNLCVPTAGGHRSASASPSQSAQGSPQRARSATTSPSQAFQPGPIPASSGPGAQKQSPQLK